MADLFGQQPERSMPVMAPNGVGRALRAAREELGLSLADIAHETRMAIRHLEAIEDGRFDGFAAPVYALGFARNYARAVGLPAQWVTDCLRDSVASYFGERGRFDLGWEAEGLRYGR